MTTPAIRITSVMMRTNYGPRRHYYAQGPDTITMPDGRVLPRRFDNSSLTDLRRVLTKAYGKDAEFEYDF